MQQLDNVRKLVLDHTADEFSGADSYSGAVQDPAAQTASLDCSLADEIDVIVSFENLGFGPVSKVRIVGRCSSASDPSVADASLWSTLNTESVDVNTGVATIVTYLAEVPITGVGQVVVTFPCRERYFSAIVWVDNAHGSRGEVYFYRRED